MLIYLLISFGDTMNAFLNKKISTFTMVIGIMFGFNTEAKKISLKKYVHKLATLVLGSGCAVAEYALGLKDVTYKLTDLAEKTFGKGAVPKATQDTMMDLFTGFIGSSLHQRIIGGGEGEGRFISVFLFATNLILAMEKIINNKVLIKKGIENREKLLSSIAGSLAKIIVDILLDQGTKLLPIEAQLLIAKNECFIEPVKCFSKYLAYRAITEKCNETEHDKKTSEFIDNSLQATFNLVKLTR
jgi:hypothetical protein